MISTITILIMMNKKFFPLKGVDIAKNLVLHGSN